MEEKTLHEKVWDEIEALKKEKEFIVHDANTALAILDREIARLEAILGLKPVPSKEE